MMSVLVKVPKGYWALSHPDGSITADTGISEDSMNSEAGIDAEFVISDSEENDVIVIYSEDEEPQSPPKRTRVNSFEVITID